MNSNVVVISIFSLYWALVDKRGQKDLISDIELVWLVLRQATFVFKGYFLTIIEPDSSKDVLFVLNFVFSFSSFWSTSGLLFGFFQRFEILGFDFEDLKFSGVKSGSSL